MSLLSKFTKLSILSKPKTHNEANALKVTLFQKVVNNITEGKKTSVAGGVTALLTIIAFGLSVIYPENKYSIVIEQNSEAIATVLILICTTLFGGFGGNKTE